MDELVFRGAEGTAGNGSWVSYSYVVLLVMDFKVHTAGFSAVTLHFKKKDCLVLIKLPKKGLPVTPEGNWFDPKAAPTTPT